MNRNKLYFKSKRNQVELIEENGVKLIRKTFHNKKNIERELFLYSILEKSKVLVPGIQSIGKFHFLLEYIPGLTALDVLEKQELEQKIDYSIWNNLIHWLVQFYETVFQYTGKQLCLNDPNLRNFIYHNKEKQFYGIDFELCEEGSYEKDIARLLAYLISYTPQNTVIKYKISEFIKEVTYERMCLDFEILNSLIHEEIQKLKIRRLKKV